MTVRDNIIENFDDSLVIPCAHDAGESSLGTVCSEAVDLCQILCAHDGCHWLTMSRDHHRFTGFGAGNAVGEMGLGISN